MGVRLRAVLHGDDEVATAGDLSRGIAAPPPTRSDRKLLLVRPLGMRLTRWERMDADMLSPFAVCHGCVGVCTQRRRVQRCGRAPTWWVAPRPCTVRAGSYVHGGATASTSLVLGPTHGLQRVPTESVHHAAVIAGTEPFWRFALFGCLLLDFTTESAHAEQEISL